MPYYEYRCKACGSVVMKWYSYWDDNVHKRVFACGCGGKKRRAWKLVKVKGGKG